MQRDKIKRATYRRQRGECADCGDLLPINLLRLHISNGAFLLCTPCKVEAVIEDHIARVSLASR